MMAGFTYVPFGNVVYENFTMSPSPKSKFCIIQYGRYTTPSSATNSNTPQCVLFRSLAFVTSNNIG